MTRTLAVLVAVAATSVSATDQHLVQREVYLMGTRARLASYAPARDVGLETLDVALRALEETDRQLSTWRADSSISSLNRQPIGTPWTAGAQICRMFAVLYEWHEKTEGAFDPAIGPLLAAWDIHGAGRIPRAADLEAARASSGMGLLSFDREHCELTRRGEVTIDVGAFGKGEALDRVAARIGPGSWLIDLGGQISVGGPSADGAPWVVSIARPLERDRPYLRVALVGGSVSTSAGSERDLIVNGTRVGHIIDPHTGRPASFRGSVTVWHSSGLAADVLSTALYVMGPDAGLRWAESHGLSACYLLAGEDGAVREVMTAGFRRLLRS